MSNQDFERDVLQRLVKLEVEVTNHLPTQINELRKAIRTVDGRLWGVVVLTLAAAIGAWVR